MSDVSYRRIIADGFWYNNPGLVQLLGLCPLLAISGTVVNSLGLGLATTLTLIASNLAVSTIRNWVRPEIRIPVYVLIIASVVTAIELSMNAYFHELYLVLGIFIPLIVTNCAIIGRAEAFASKNTLPRAFVDGLTMGLGFTAVLVALGGMREALGHGTLFDQAHLMFGEAARGLTITLVEDYRGFLLAILPPGAFIGLGLLLAMKNWIDDRLERRQARRREAVTLKEAEA
ncbi:electron transport complex RsxE subunit [Ectothiorhodospira haloalkaliphila]|uniref:Ion-translocating oxidoreductase complex subunit E n=1 Tax=Ectothiorhodospira haloalkaliphila TaxID=421628 RepID=W8KJG8_9GAMM|nr:MULTISPECIES: electron transport complex subunit E [Ectothiorhodospira]AHK79949.1 electron transport complex RsxE subunit [Ectothiorhodospira haloalkaliphila]MCG5493594.1 electron transport complex subunit E [Ectothiorhodospira variabilis]MCG5496941.1 electron transport complex subunit E [Ectothiorhodospira variabilis]MCG5502923.1 electron transport complex subunit E [Ectothiorhodospira variabilis]MCG5506289.1 electron transport complex subunit E [Ectothiorhodospira variabilis]